MKVTVTRSKSSNKVVVELNGVVEFDGEIDNLDLDFLKVLKNIGYEVEEVMIE